MKILAVDCAGSRAAVALIESGQLLASATGGVRVSASESLLTLIDEVLRESKASLRAVDGFAVGIGPGSFTGIRIGAATIKALAQVLDRKILPFSSLEALARSVGVNQSGTAVFVNAFQGHGFVGQYSDRGHWSETACLPAQWVAAQQLAPEFQCLWIGPTENVAAYHALVQSRRAPPQVVADGVVEPAVLAEVVSRSSHWQTAESLMVHYLRPSHAEIKLNAIVSGT